MNLKKLTLATVCNGAVEEMFQAELAKLIANIDDPNTIAKEKRKLILEFTIEPNTERNYASVSLQTKTALAKLQPVPGTMILEAGQAQTTVDIERPLFDDEGQVTDISGRPLKNKTLDGVSK